MDALEDDVNTAAAMGPLFNMVRIAGRVLEDKKLRNSEGGRDILRAFRDATAKWDTLLGLFAQKPEGFFEKTAVHRPDFMIRYMLNDHLEGGNDPWWSLCVLWVSPASAATR